MRLCMPIVLARGTPLAWASWSGIVALLVGLGLTALTTAVAVLLFTRWRPWPAWKKCLLVSVMLHLWAAAGLSTISLPMVPLASDPLPPLCVALEDWPAGDQASPPTAAKETSTGKASLVLKPESPRPAGPGSSPPTRQASSRSILTALDKPTDQVPSDTSGRDETVGKPPAAPASAGSSAPPTAAIRRVSDLPETTEPEDLASGPADLRPGGHAGISAAATRAGDGSGELSDRAIGAVQVSAPFRPQSPQSHSGSAAARQGVAIPQASTGQVGTAPPTPRDPSSLRPVLGPHPASGHIPAPYRWRVASDRLERAKRFGASEESENAVQRALAWLVANQEPDGRWNPRRHGAGEERYESGRDRQGAGSRADTGITGLALLALAAAGNTHRQGQYATSVEKAVKYLLDSQAADGNLAGPAATYEFMYCHGIATLALSEVFGLSQDPGLRQPVASAVAYSVASQDPLGGGWRYRPQEPGDTSQLGWQLMALNSAELAGIPVPPSTWDGAARYLEGVSAGNHGGLAAYRPGERVTRTMTAEALVCRLLLGLTPTHPAAREAGDFLLGELPGEGVANRYYWYYATMAMYQLQGSHWELWNRALQRTLLATQRRDGPLAGSWDPTTRWDGYGGRVYATALAALCLEAYYRFLPPHADASPSTSALR